MVEAKVVKQMVKLVVMEQQIQAVVAVDQSMMPALQVMEDQVL